MEEDFGPRRRDIYDEPLPFDELDPCCQKEIINERKKKEVNSKLRTVDRSNRRLDTQHAVFTYYGVNSCHCCQKTIDYEALRRLKANLTNSVGDLEEKGEKAELSEQDEDEDDEFDDLDIDIPLTEEEQLRLVQVEKYKQDLELAKKYGLGVYWEDSIEHLTEFIENPNVPLILHVYQPTSLLCAQIDYIIETSLCEQYLGTRFRRIAYNYQLPRHPALTKYENQIQSNGTILCFKSKDLLIHQSNFEEFGDDIDIISLNLRKLLSNAHILERSLPHLSLLFPNDPKAQRFSNGTDDEEEEEERYCEDPDCIKRYPHEHIGKASAPSFLGNRVGDEVFAANQLQRI